MAIYSWKNALYGGLIYASGDSIAAFISDKFLLSRMLGIMLTGATLYAFEIPNYFNWINQRCGHSGLGSSISRALLALAYFNPLWISRHFVLLLLFSGQWASISRQLLFVALESFLFSVPITLVANMIIQNLIPLPRRFFASAFFSALMAIYYALSEVLFA